MRVIIKESKGNIMKKSIIKQAIASVAGIALAAGILFSAGTVSAIQYTGATTPPSPVPAFNVYTGVDQGVGNESDFLRARVPVATPDTSTLYTDNVAPTCVDGQNIQMRVYVHNGASADNNGSGNGASVAHGTSVKVTLPSGGATSFSTNAQISASNTATVNDTTTINCNGKMVKLTYVAGSAKANSIGTGTVALSDSLVTTGAAISSQGVAGDVWGCWNERVYVIFTVKVEVVPPVVIPATCDLLAATTAGKTVTVNTVNYTANNATVNGLVLNFGNGVSKPIAFSQLPYSYTYPNAGNFTVTATLKTSLGDVSNNSTCSTPVSPVNPTPATCDLLSFTTNGNTITITEVKVTANGATINSIVLNFGNGVSKTITASQIPYVYTYPTAGNYSMTATIKTSLGDVAPSDACTAPVKIASPTPATCDLVKITKNDRTVTITEIKTTSNGATVTSIVIDFGNGVTKTITTSQLPYSYTYPTAGNYTVTATVKTSLGDVTSTACTVAVSPTNPATPVVLPNTGAGGTIAVFLGVSLVGAYLYRMRMLKNLQ
jgi:PKD repeat protein